MTQNADSGRDIESTIHGYYRQQGYESCPDCGKWLLPPKDEAIAQSVAWQAADLCFACGAPATHQVMLPWMGEGGRPYCPQHAFEWGNAGYWRLIHERGNT